MSPLIPFSFKHLLLDVARSHPLQIESTHWGGTSMPMVRLSWPKVEGKPAHGRGDSAGGRAVLQMFYLPSSGHCQPSYICVLV
jgi:hypothetical protein